MSKARPRDFESEGQYQTAHVTHDLRVDLFGEGSTLEHQIDADRVLVGGGLPDEAVELRPDPAGGRADFHRADGIDVCVRHDGGDVVVWLAP